MTDERIKEEFERWTPSNPTTQELAFIAAIDNPAWQCEAVGFYAGFRAAERLAKTEVLSDLLVTIEKLDECPVDEYAVGKNDGYSRVIDIINELLSSIKE